MCRLHTVAIYSVALIQPRFFLESFFELFLFFRKTPLKLNSVLQPSDPNKRDRLFDGMRSAACQVPRFYHLSSIKLF